MARLTTLCCALLFVIGDARSYGEVVDYDDFYSVNDEKSNETSVIIDPSIVLIAGNLILILFYGILLIGAAKIISDGAELLLDLGLPAAIVGGVLLPLLGAIPSSAMILFVGVTGSKEEANEQIAIGMSGLARSTVMLLTVCWNLSLVLGRVDIVNGEGRDEQVGEYSFKSFINQGVTVCPDVTYSALIMLITTLPYFILQGTDWRWGPSRTVPAGQSHYCALVTFIIAFIFLLAYLAFQVVFSVNSKRKEQARRKYMTKQDVLNSIKPAEKEPNCQKGEALAPTVESVYDMKWLIALKSSLLLIVGIGAVVIFYDPMLDALISITDTSNEDYTFNSNRGQYITNGVIFSFFFASKKKKTTTSVAYSQLYGAATMNNTLCLAVFAALVYFRDLNWQFSAEVTVTLLIEYAVGITAIVAGFAAKHTYRLFHGFFVGPLYFLPFLILRQLPS